MTIERGRPTLALACLAGALLGTLPLRPARAETVCSDKRAPILVVSSYATLRRIVRNLLQEIGYGQISEADNGTGALYQLRSAPYALVISEITMEPMGGLELLRQVRMDPRLSRTPFLVITPKADRDAIVQIAQAGANGFIVKPFNAATLDTKLRAICGG